ncbi:MAG TPA: BLUF domain-containing protein [Fimbriimonas sp.]|nr:BLUF domain-containing protein [Fimbriimonas sp.]
MAGTVAMEGSRTLLQCIYVSTAFHPMSDSELVSLLETSRRTNVEAGISGVLIYCDGCFLQVIEGPAEVVDSLFESISKDRRHHSVTQLVYEEVSKRAFSQLDMGFVKATSDDLHVISGFDGMSSLADLDGGQAKILLDRFRTARVA